MEYEGKDKVEAAKAMLEEAGVLFKIWTPETAQEFIGQEVHEWALWEFLSLAEYEGLESDCDHEDEVLATALDVFNDTRGSSL